MAEQRVIKGTNGGPRTVQEARRAVEQSRQRVSATLDELEGRIVDTKQAIQQKMDFVKPVQGVIRNAPFIALGAAVAIGLFLGTRGGEQDDEDDDGFDRDERAALEEWRQRRRRMLLDEAEADEAFEEEEEVAPKPGFMRMLGHELAGVVVGIVAAEVAERLYGARAGDADSGDDSDDDGDE